VRERERKRGYGGRGKPKVSKSVSRSSKTGLQFPVGRITRFQGTFSLLLGTMRNSASFWDLFFVPALYCWHLFSLFFMF